MIIRSGVGREYRGTHVKFQVERILYGMDYFTIISPDFFHAQKFPLVPLTMFVLKALQTMEIGRSFHDLSTVGSAMTIQLIFEIFYLCHLR